jgi:SAM-dependent methyltransferase
MVSSGRVSGPVVAPDVEGRKLREHGGVFDRLAGEYDRHRPEYPNALIDRVCELAGLSDGDRVLEVGCGTGQLTRSLTARGLRVTAIEPGGRLIALADAKLGGEVEFINARLEDAALPPRSFAAAFSASAFHWTDPDVSWRSVAEALVPGGTFALISHLGLLEEATALDGELALEALRRAAPEIAAGWPRYRGLAATLEGVERRGGNISEVWAWLGNYDLARPYVGGLFGDVRIDAIPIRQEHSGEEMNALLRTTSLSSRLAPEQFAALERSNLELCRRLGRPFRSSALAAAVTGRRTDRP